VASGQEATRPPPTPERLETFFAFGREQIATARKYGTAGRDYTLFRTLYHAGVRSDEAARLDVSDVHLDRGPFGKLHVRFGKGTRTSGPRARWVPLLDGLDLILGWYLAEIRPRFGSGPALFCDEGGGAIHRGTVGNRLRVALSAERAGPGRPFQSARLASCLCDAQLRARRRPRRYPAVVGTLADRDHDAIREPIVDVH